MATAHLTTTANPHIAALETIFDKATKPVEGLVIAHNDSRMLQSIYSALNGESAAILEVSQDTWSLDKNLAEAIEWALQQGDVKKLILVGNSQAGGAKSQAFFVASRKQNESAYANLLAGVKHCSAKNRDAQERFASLVQQMSQLPVVQNRWSSGALAVHALFYRAESGLYLAYDPGTDSFRPLLTN